MKAEPFQPRNAACRKNKGDLVLLDINHKRLDKNSSALVGRYGPEWFIIVNPVLSDTNGGINAVCSGPSDTSLVDTNMDELNSENKVEEDIEYNDVSSDEHESESEHFVKAKRRWHMRS